MNIVIIEDEELLSARLATLLRELNPAIEIAAILPSVKAANRWFLLHPMPDLIFMDIQLSDGISFEILDTTELNCPVIFTTAYDEYALKAFRVNSIDYILKPVEEKELMRALDKYKKIQSWSTQRDQLSNTIKQWGSDETNYKKRFLVQQGNSSAPVDVTNIAYFCRENDVVFLYTLDGNRHIADHSSLDEIEELVDPGKFFRANRQCLLQDSCIESYYSHHTGKIQVLLKKPFKEEIEVSKTRAAIFRKWIDA